MATKTSVSDVYTETLTPMQQLRRAADLFEPIANRILGATTGNHCERIVKTDSIDLMELLARELGFAYCAEGLLLFVRVGEQSGGKHHRPACYTIYVSHGTGGGRTLGGKVNAVERMTGIIDADIYVMSHVHTPSVSRQAYYRTDAKNSSVQRVERMLVVTGATLNYGGYAQRYGFVPASLMTPVIRLCGTDKHFDAMI